MVLHPTGVGQSRHTEEDDANGLRFVDVSCTVPLGEIEDEEEDVEKALDGGYVDGLMDDEVVMAKSVVSR